MKAKKNNDPREKYILCIKTINFEGFGEIEYKYFCSNCTKTIAVGTTVCPKCKSILNELEEEE